MTGIRWDGFPVQALDRIWRPPSGGRAVLRAKAYVWNGKFGSDPASASRAQLQRIVDRAPQVMVKVSGRQKGADHVSAHFEYIGRHGELDVETDEGEILKDVAELRERAQEWRESDDSTRVNSVMSISMVLSMPGGTDPGKVLTAARAFARVELEGEHHYMLAFHDDTDHPHVHLTVAVAPIEANGLRFNPRKDDLYRMRETFAHELRERGIDADATARRARGMTRRTDNITLKKLTERYQAQGETPRSVAAARDAGESYARGEGKLFPWEQAAVVKQRQIKAAYTRVAARLAESPLPEDRSLATRIDAFVEQMPSAISRRLDHTLAYVERVKCEQGAEAAARLGMFQTNDALTAATAKDPAAPPAGRANAESATPEVFEAAPHARPPKPPPERSR